VWYVYFELSSGHTSTALRIELSEKYGSSFRLGRNVAASSAGRGDVPIEPGVCLTIPLGHSFPVSRAGSEPLAALGVTMPPWLQGSPYVYKQMGTTAGQAESERDLMTAKTVRRRVRALNRDEEGHAEMAQVVVLRAHAAGPPQVLRAFSPGQPTLQGRPSRGPRWVRIDATRQQTIRLFEAEDLAWKHVAELPSRTENRRPERPRLSRNVVPPAGRGEFFSKGHQHGIGYCQLGRYEIPFYHESGPENPSHKLNLAVEGAGRCGSEHRMLKTPSRREGLAFSLSFLIGVVAGAQAGPAECHRRARGFSDFG